MPKYALHLANCKTLILQHFFKTFKILHFAFSAWFGIVLVPVLGGGTVVQWWGWYSGTVVGWWVVPGIFRPARYRVTIISGLQVHPYITALRFHWNSSTSFRQFGYSRCSSLLHVLHVLPASSSCSLGCGQHLRHP